MTQARGIFLVAAGLAVATALWAAESANNSGGGYVVYPPDKEGKYGAVVFSHLAHGEGEKKAGYTCDDCHKTRQIPLKTRSFTMADINAGKGCGQCHDGKTKAPGNGEVAVELAKCTGCHTPVKDTARKTKGPGSVTFSHATHTGTLKEGKVVENAGYSCGECHPKVVEAKAGAPLKMATPHTKGGCATCHDGKTKSPSGKTAMSATTAANCMKCHKPGG